MCVLICSSVLPHPSYINCYAIYVLTKIFNSFSNLGAYPQNAQIELACQSGQWSTSVLNSAENNLLTENLLATLTTPLRTNCSFCISPERTLSTDLIHHCVGTYVHTILNRTRTIMLWYIFQCIQIAMMLVVQKV